MANHGVALTSEPPLISVWHRPVCQSSPQIVMLLKPGPFQPGTSSLNACMLLMRGCTQVLRDPEASRATKGARAQGIKVLGQLFCDAAEVATLKQAGQVSLEL